MVKAAILVADGGRARLFAVQPPGRFDRRVKVEEVADFIHPAQRMADGQRFSTTKPGVRNRPDRAGHGKGLQTSDDRRDGHDAEEGRRFAETVVHGLAQHLRQTTVRKVVVVAEARFLGVLRKVLAKHALPVPMEEWDKDLSHLDGEQVYERLVDAGLLLEVGG